MRCEPAADDPNDRDPLAHVSVIISHVVCVRPDPGDVAPNQPMRSRTRRTLLRRSRRRRLHDGH